MSLYPLLIFFCYAYATSSIIKTKIKFYKRRKKKKKKFHYMFYSTGIFYDGIHVYLFLLNVSGGFDPKFLNPQKRPNGINQVILAMMLFLVFNVFYVRKTMGL